MVTDSPLAELIASLMSRSQSVSWPNMKSSMDIRISRKLPDFISSNPSQPSPSTQRLLHVSYVGSPLFVWHCHLQAVKIIIPHHFKKSSQLLIHGWPTPPSRRILYDLVFSDILLHHDFVSRLYLSCLPITGLYVFRNTSTRTSSHCRRISEWASV